MKTVFTNAQCAHVWAQQNQSYGKTNNGNMFFEGRTIYSYGHHFPLAHFLSPDLVAVNEDSYSVTTSAHQSDVRASIPSEYTLVYLPSELMEKINTLTFDSLTRYFPKLLDDVNSLIAQAGRRRKAWLAESDISVAISKILSIQVLSEHLGGQLPDDLTEKLESLQSGTFDNGKLKALIEKQKAEDAERKEKARAEYLERLELWRNHSPDVQRCMPIPECKEIALRLSDIDTIETSYSANFPVSAAKRVFPYIQAVREKGTEKWHKNGHRLQLGSFEVDWIDEKGNVKAGCHFVKWQEIERMASILGLV